MKNVLLIWPLLLLLAGACDEKPEEEEPEEENDELIEVDWTAAADSATGSLIDHYWNTQADYFNYTNDGNQDFHYWPQAHALDVLVDAYIRTEDELYLEYMDKWYDGVKAKNGHTFVNDFYDDMEWNALAMLRAWQVNGNDDFIKAVLVLWDDILTGWNDHAGGGIMWKKGEPYGKNACSNGPAAILGARLYQVEEDEAYLDRALDIYNWEKEMLFDTSSGAVWDHVVEENGDLQFKKDWIFTYNQGTFLGAALELYKITDEQFYLDDAVKAADYTLRNLTDSHDGLLKSEGEGDGGLFKGIFVRYFTQLVLHPDLDEEDRSRFLSFLEHNAQTLWTKGANKSAVLFGPHWKQKPPYSVDLTVQLSGVMLMEAAALLENEDLLD
ncbi:MAG: glycoside hydrolase family 76 protein [Marinilabiliaceae bacterium]